MIKSTIFMNLSDPSWQPHHHQSQSSRRRSNRFSQYHLKGTSDSSAERTSSVRSKKDFAPNIASLYGLGGIGYIP
jgi:hypothetical protein